MAAKRAVSTHALYEGSPRGILERFAYPKSPAVIDPRISQSDAELRSHVMRVLESQYDVDKEIGRGGSSLIATGRLSRLSRPL